MEKKIKRTPKNTKSVSPSSEEKTIIITIIVALVILGALLLNLIFFTPIETEPFSAIYYLDSEKQLENIPKTVVLGENSTFSLWVGVENQNDKPLDYQVNVTIRTFPAGDSSVEQTESHESKDIRPDGLPVEDEERWEFQVEINIDQLGSNEIIFELGFLNAKEKWVDTGNWVNLQIEAI